MPVDYEGPRDGDRVQIEAAGTVVEVQVRDDVPGALIELDHGGAVLWLSGTARPVLRAQERTSAVDGSERWESASSVSAARLTSAETARSSSTQA